MDFVANFVRFPAGQKIKNRLRFDNVTESSKVGTSFWDTMYTYSQICHQKWIQGQRFPVRRKNFSHPMQLFCLLERFFETMHIHTQIHSS